MQHCEYFTVKFWLKCKCPGLENDSCVSWGSNLQEFFDSRTCAGRELCTLRATFLNDQEAVKAIAHSVNLFLFLASCEAAHQLLVSVGCRNLKCHNFTKFQGAQKGELKTPVRKQVHLQTNGRGYEATAKVVIICKCSCFLVLPVSVETSDHWNAGICQDNNSCVSNN